jgi:hypothetical protein
MTKEKEVLVGVDVWEQGALSLAMDLRQRRRIRCVDEWCVDELGAFSSGALMNVWCVDECLVR